MTFTKGYRWINVKYARKNGEEVGQRKALLDDIHRNSVFAWRYMTIMSEKLNHKRRGATLVVLLALFCKPSEGLEGRESRAWIVREV
jgi:hypothetical protein